MKHAIIMAAAALTLVGCSSAEEKLCRASMTKTLINPETAKYSGFRIVSQEEIKSNPFMEFRPRIMENIIPQKGATYATMKVRAEGNLGNVITNQQFCAIDAAKDQCFCLGSD